VVGLDDESFDLVIRNDSDYMILDSMVSSCLNKRGRKEIGVRGRIAQYDTDYDSNEDLGIENEEIWAYRRRI